MLLGYLLTNTAQFFADVRTYWSPDAVKRVSGWAFFRKKFTKLWMNEQTEPGRQRGLFLS